MLIPDSRCKAIAKAILIQFFKLQKSSKKIITGDRVRLAYWRIIEKTLYLENFCVLLLNLTKSKIIITMGFSDIFLLNAHVFRRSVLLVKKIFD